MLDKTGDRAIEREIWAGLDPMPVAIPEGESLTVRTVDRGNYPTQSPAVFACVVTSATADETEDADVTVDVEDLGALVYVANLSTVVPPIGQDWIAERTRNDRLVMIYNGPAKK